MAAELKPVLRPRPRARLWGLLGLLIVIGAVYFSLPRSWFEVPDEAPAATPTAPPAEAASLETLRAAAERTPLDYTARSRYGMALNAAGRGPEALREFEAALHLAPESPVVHHNLGVYYLNNNDFARADGAFCRELELTPGDGRAHYYRGLIFQKRNQNERALRQFELTVALAPDFPDAYLSLALLGTRKESEEKIRGWIDQYIRLTGNEALAYYVLSGAYRTWRKYPEAARYAERTVTLEPNSYTYWHNLGQVYSYARRTDDAERALKRALSLAPRSFTSLLSIEQGMNAQNAGRFSEAVRYFQEALAASPETGNIHLYLARVYQRMGDETSAQREEAAFRQWERRKQERQKKPHDARQPQATSPKRNP